MAVSEEIYESVKRLYGYDPEAAQFERIVVGDSVREQAEEPYAMSMETTLPVADAEVLAPLVLTAADRCVRCGAQAYTNAEHIDHGELLFCAHHGREHKEKLVATGWLVTETTVPA